METPYRWDGRYLTLQEVDAWAQELKKHAAPGTARFNFTINASIIRYFLGDAWFEKHMYLDAHPDSFLRPDFSKGDADPRYSIHTLEFAEMLLNLQVVRGFARVLENLSLKQLESGLAELHIGTILRKFGVPFRYVEEGDSTTVDIMFRAPDGSDALCEIKCKYETTGFSESSLRSAIGEARRQIGKGNTGVVFVKIPVSWMYVEQASAREKAVINVPPQVIAVAKSELRQTSRIKKLIFYVAHHAYEEGWGLSVTQATMEFTNSKNAAPWKADLFSSYQPGAWYSLHRLAQRWEAEA